NSKFPPMKNLQSSIFNFQFLERTTVALAFLITGLSIHAGNIIGTVTAQGKPGTEADPTCNKYDSRQFKFVERVNYSEMRDFLVHIEGPVGGKPVVPEKPVQVITKRVMQKGAMFSPHVLPIVVGTTVEWPNNDDILHNVFSFSELKAFDL